MKMFFLMLDDPDDINLNIPVHIRPKIYTSCKHCILLTAHNPIIKYYIDDKMMMKKWVWSHLMEWLLSVLVGWNLIIIALLIYMSNNWPYKKNLS